ncbi:hypothetical protein OXPF_27230 [Oxobacter pfennigii]|uniref:Lipoprotein n=1 Tax=Oxobacter pfennigii TaxID=36849 RepID=A0A0P8W6D0_9CLOT|nr:hypothetical protein [Oxobacter pfennigii]KPU43282.1 hypothetical protein OXPF_27230 [Oxobacter pfennigii]
MKRIIYITISVLTLIAVLSSCSFKNTVNTASLNASGENKEKNPNISIQSPMTLSNNDMFPIVGQHQYLRLKMVEGKYYEDWNPGAFIGTIWEGYFIIELADESGNTIAQADLSKLYNEPLIFNSSFQVQFDDYNNDGNIDFTIGQYASSNGRNYKLFTLGKDGKIEELPVKGYSSLFISNTTGYYSTKLTKVDNSTFKIEYYDNSEGKSFEDTFKWGSKEFIKVESHELPK